MLGISTDAVVYQPQFGTIDRGRLAGDAYAYLHGYSTTYSDPHLSSRRHVHTCSRADQHPGPC